MRADGKGLETKGLDREQDADEIQGRPPPPKYITSVY